jgi:hypothetical protein
VTRIGGGAYHARTKIHARANACGTDVSHRKYISVITGCSVHAERVGAEAGLRIADPLFVTDARSGADDGVTQVQTSTDTLGTNVINRNQIAIVTRLAIGAHRVATDTRLGITTPDIPAGA